MGNAREVDLGMMMGAGIVPGPLAQADALGLDNALAGLKHAETQWGEGFKAPTLLKRLVAQGRTGKAAGQGFFAYPQPAEGDQAEVVLFEKRGPVGIAWLKAKPVNPISAELVRDLEIVYDRAEADPEIKSLVIASANTAIFSAGANLKAFAAFGPEDVANAIDATNAIFRKIETGRLITIAAVNGGAFGGGCELSMSAQRPPRWRVGDFRSAGNQPRDHPGLRRIAAPPATGRQGGGLRDHRRWRQHQRLACPGNRPRQ